MAKTSSAFDRFSTREQTFKVEVEILPETEASPPFIVTCQYNDGKDLEDLSEQSMTRNRSGQMEVDHDKYRRGFCKKHIVTWSGLTLEHAAVLMPKRTVSFDIGAFYEEFPEGEIPYSEKTALDLYREAEAHQFFNIIRDELALAAKLMAEQRAKEVRDAQKKFRTTPASSGA